jgi:hypothetical protein
MKKITFLMLVLIVNYAAYSQSEYGIFVKTIQPPAFPNGKGELVKANHNINIETNSLNLYTNVLGQTQYFEEFWTISNNEADIYYNFEDSSENNLCYQSGSINWNLLTEPSKSIVGCIAETYLYVIHVTSTDVLRSKCPEDIIELHDGWNWQYRFDGSNWEDFAPKFQEQRSISFKINELAGFENKTKVYFQAGFGTQFTNILPFDISPCTPKIVSTSAPNLTKCTYSNDGAVTFTFERELQDGEQYEMALLYENGRAVLDGNKTIPKDSMTTPTTYTWNNLEAENYQLTYYITKKVGTTVYPNSPALRNSFTISPAPELQFSVSGVNPLCHNDTVELVIHVTGGTGPYRFYLDNIEKFPVQEIEGFYHLKNLLPKSYDVKVTDANNCIDTN